MISFFPTPYPDELLASVLGRYHVRSGNISPKLTMTELFGSSTACAVVDLPSHVDDLIANLPLHHPYTSEGLILNHTMFPLYTAFLPPRRAENILSDMHGHGGRAVYLRSGLMASSVVANRYLKFCPMCVIEERKRLGESYWHRLHQVHGVQICLRHRYPLRDSTVPTTSFNRHEFVVSNEQTCEVTEDKIERMGGHEPPSIDTWIPEQVDNSQSNQSLSEREFTLAANVDRLLRTRYPNRSMEWFHQQYLQKLQQRGIATTNGRIDQEALSEALVSFYGVPYLKAAQSLPESQSQNWISEMARKPRKTFHPIRHLLFMQFLGLTLDELFHGISEYRPFGEPPWPCLNPAADHYRERVVTDVMIRHDSSAKAPMGTFSCSCGFVYVRRGPDVDTQDQYNIGRVKVFGPVWERRLHQLRDDGVSMREAARQLRVDINTVRKYLHGKKTEGVKLSSAVKKGLLGEHRAEWMLLVGEHQEYSIQEIRHLNQALYAWLYRHDRDWLVEHIPRRPRTNTGSMHVDWGKRDEELLEEVRSAAEDIMRLDGKPVRITPSRIGKMTGKLAILQRYLGRLPKTNAYLNSVVETVEQYQLRRVHWAIRSLEDEGHEPVWWRVAKKAGLDERSTVRLRSHMEP